MYFYCKVYLVTPSLQVALKSLPLDGASEEFSFTLTPIVKDVSGLSLQILHILANMCTNSTVCVYYGTKQFIKGSYDDCKTLHTYNDIKFKMV